MPRTHVPVQAIDTQNGIFDRMAEHFDCAADTEVKLDGKQLHQQQSHRKQLQAGKSSQ